MAEPVLVDGKWKGALGPGDAEKMMKRRLKDAGLPLHLSPHSFRVAVANDLLDQGCDLAQVQHFLGHADPRTNRIYRRRKFKATRNMVERISYFRQGRVETPATSS